MDDQHEKAGIAVAVSHLVKETAANPSRYLRARAALMAELDPCLRRIPREVRAAIDELILTRRAPSPFCIVRAGQGVDPN